MGDDEQLSDEEKARRGEEIVDAELTGADDAFTRVELKETVDPEAVEATTTDRGVRESEREVVETGEETEEFGGGAEE